MPLPLPALLLAKAYVLAGMSLCPAAATPPDTKVEFISEAPVFDHSKSIDTLTYNASLKGEMEIPEGHENVKIRTMGTTISTFRVSRNFTYDHKTGENGMTCLYLKEAHISVTYSPVIYIGKELNDYPCRLKKTKPHEERHVAIANEVVNKELDTLRDALKRISLNVAPKEPFAEKELEAREKETSLKLRQMLRPTQNKIVAAFEKSQGEIDTFENYKYESGLCPHEELKL